MAFRLTTSEILVHVFISSKLDNRNSLLYGLPYNLIKKLQHAQNAAARLVAQKGETWDIFQPISILPPFSIKTKKNQATAKINTRKQLSSI